MLNQARGLFRGGYCRRLGMGHPVTIARRARVQTTERQAEEVRRELKSRAAYVNREYHSDIDDLRVISALSKRATSNRRPRFEARQTNESKYSLRYRAFVCRLSTLLERAFEECG